MRWTRSAGDVVMAVKTLMTGVSEHEYDPDRHHIIVNLTGYIDLDRRGKANAQRALAAV